jgi:hypothetical protein
MSCCRLRRWIGSPTAIGRRVEPVLLSAADMCAGRAVCVHGQRLILGPQSTSINSSTVSITQPTAAKNVPRQ